MKWSKDSLIDWMNNVITYLYMVKGCVQRTCPLVIRPLHERFTSFHERSCLSTKRCLFVKGCQLIDHFYKLNSNNRDGCIPPVERVISAGSPASTWQSSQVTLMDSAKIILFVQGWWRCHHLMYVSFSTETADNAEKNSHLPPNGSVGTCLRLCHLP